jgi:hypothetical protein
MGVKRVIELRIRYSAALLCALATASGCGSGAVTAFGSRFPDNDREMTAAVVRALCSPSLAGDSGNALGRPLVVAFSHVERPEIIVHDIEAGRTLWRRELRAGRRPQVLGDLVLTTVGQKLVALALASGDVRWKSPVQGEIFMGAARWKEVLVHTSGDASFGSVRSRSHVTALDARTGERLWRYAVGGRLGKPEVAAAMVFVPWDLQSLVVLDAHTGRELARLRATDDVISWVKADPDGVFFGHRSIYRLGERGYAGVNRGVPRLAPPLPEIAALPTLRESAYTFKPAERSAEGRIGFFFHTDAAGGEGIRFEDDRFYLVFYRYVFAFDSAGDLAWCRLLNSESIGAESVSGGLIAVLESGEVEWLAAGNGRTLRSTRLPAPLSSAEVDAEAMTAVDNADSADSTSFEGGLHSELVRIALDPDNRLLLARIYAVKKLARLSDPEVTRDLLLLYEQGPLPKMLKDAVAGGLSERRSGEEYLLQALSRHHDFLRGIRVPPLDVIVPALVRMGEKRAVPSLIGHLFEPETPLQALPGLVAAIDVLGDRMVGGPLLDFVSRYRADSSFAGSAPILAKAAAAVLRRGDSRQREELRRIASRPGTHEMLAESIDGMLANGRGKEARDEQPVSGKSEALPDRLEQRAIDRVFSRQVDAIRACIVEELGRSPRLSRVRIAFVLENSGRASDFRFSPGSPGLVECLVPAIKQCRFPRFRTARQLASYTVTLRPDPEADGGKETASAPSPSGEPEAWWASARSKSEAAAAGNREPGRSPWWFHAVTGRNRESGASESSPEVASEAPTPSPEVGPRDRENEPAAPSSAKTTDEPWWLPAEP